MGDLIEEYYMGYKGGYWEFSLRLMSNCKTPKLFGRAWNPKTLSFSPETSG